MTALDEAAIFRRLRRLARDSGFQVRKVKGGYQLIEGERVVAGDRHPLGLQDLARELQRRHILGRR